jgi:hypothetical protein
MKNKKTVKSGYKGPERRRYIRFSYPFFVRSRKDGEKHNSKVHPLITFKELAEDQVSISQNVSIGGIFFTTSKDYPTGTLLFVEIFSPTRKTPFNMLARVAWRKKRVLGHDLGYTYDTGVEFLEIDEEGEFQDLLEQLVKSRLEKKVLV